jgi:ABC-type multidrug transport system ATPase subunit
MDQLYIDSVQHSFGSRNVLNNVYLSCSVGEIIGVLGRNGCGKSTLLKIIFGTIAPHFKHLKIDGQLVKKGYLTGKVAYLSQAFFIPHYLKLSVAIKLYAQTHVKQLVNLAPIKNNLNQPIGSLSGGYRRFIEALLIIYSDAKFVLLDEPFSQLSPQLIDEMKIHIKAMQPYKGFIVTDHYYQQIVDISSRMMLINHGCNYTINTTDDLILYGYLPNR